MLQQLEKGVFGVISHAIGAVLRNGFVGLILGLVLGEASGAALDGNGFPPKIFVHVASIAFALALGFAFAMTTALVEGVKGLVGAARAIEGDARQAAGAGLRDVGQIVESVERRKP
ncbi:MAG: hypothetical protein IVW57_12835 [Ktedonobacterales bacterium]|nr:hypothetical protein [Ktedonobacterales bacterium]